MDVQYGSLLSKQRISSIRGEFGCVLEVARDETPSDWSGVSRGRTGFLWNVEALQILE